MVFPLQRSVVSLLSAAACALLSLAALSVRRAEADEFSDLIDQLLEIESPDTGYAQFFSGSNFLPYDDTEQIGTFIIGATHRDKSPVMKKLVEKGFAAVPQLLEHLNDHRKVKIPPIESGGIMMWMSFDNEYDFNRVTTAKVPQGVNLDTFASEDQPDRHEITVGDLCYVALGQILNRYWSASRYQPTGGRIISSPTYSKELRQAIMDEWGELDEDGHRLKLIEDFRKPDSEDRVVGAYLRLSLYYPDEVEPLVLELLGRSIPDGQKVSDFSNQLLEIDDPDARKAKLNAILNQHGQYYRNALLTSLFDEIRSTDMREANGIQLSDEELRVRRVLHETFDWPKPVRYEDWSKQAIVAFDNYELARIIRACTHDNSLAVGQKIQSILESDRFKTDDYMAASCLTSLASREQFGSYLADRLKQHDYRSVTKADLPPVQLSAIAKSQSTEVKAELGLMAESCNDPDLFLVAAKATASESWGPVMARAKKLITKLDPNSRDGKELLQLIVDKSPDEAETILNDFLKPNTPWRCNTVCEVLWYGNPLSQRVLLPLLDDDRQLPGWSVSVRDRAATAISHSIESLRYDSDWSKRKRDEVIKEIKAYCKAQEGADSGNGNS